MTPPTDDVQSRADILAMAPPPSLPPNQKLAKDIWGDVVWLVLLGFSLIAAKWGVIAGADFNHVLLGVLIAKASLSTGKGISLDAIQSFMKK